MKSHQKKPDTGAKYGGKEADGKSSPIESKEGKGGQRKSNIHREKRETGKRGGREKQPNKMIYQIKAKSVIKYINMADFFFFSQKCKRRFGKSQKEAALSEKFNYISPIQ